MLCPQHYPLHNPAIGRRTEKDLRASQQRTWLKEKYIRDLSLSPCMLLLKCNHASSPTVVNVSFWTLNTNRLPWQLAEFFQLTYSWMTAASLRYSLDVTHRRRMVCFFLSI